MKIAAAAEACEVNVAPHNFYGHLCTMINAHFSAAVPNLRIMETDIDRLAWDHELFTHVPEIVDGHLILPDRPGWGSPEITSPVLATSGMVAELFSLLGALRFACGLPQSQAERRSSNGMSYQ